MSSEENLAVDKILSIMEQADAGQTEQQEAPETASQTAEQTETEAVEQSERVEPEETPAIEPPSTWKADLKSRWNEIPPHLQRDLAQWETERNQGVNSKLNESAEAKKAAEAIKAQAEETRQRYATQLEALTQQAVALDPVLSHASKMKPDDWQKLWAENPAQAGLLKHEVEQRIATIQNWRMQQQTLQQEQMRTLQTQAEAALSEKMPEWRDEAKRTELRTGITRMLQEQYGYKPEELANLLDHRSVLVARDAMLYRQMMAARQTAETKKVPPAPQKVVKPVSTQGERGESPRVKALKQRAIRTGKEADGVNAILAAIGDS